MYKEHRKRTLEESRGGRRCGPRGRPVAPWGATWAPQLRLRSPEDDFRTLPEPKPSIFNGFCMVGGRTQAKLQNSSKTSECSIPNGFCMVADPVDPALVTATRGGRGGGRGRCSLMSTLYKVGVSGGSVFWIPICKGKSFPLWRSRRGSAGGACFSCDVRPCRAGRLRARRRGLGCDDGEMTVTGILAGLPRSSPRAASRADARGRSFMQRRRRKGGARALPCARCLQCRAEPDPGRRDRGLSHPPTYPTSLCDKSDSSVHVRVLLLAHYSLLITHHPSLVTHHSPLIIHYPASRGQWPRRRSRWEREREQRELGGDDGPDPPTLSAV
eukprot:gene11574-biopygen13272